MTDFRYRTLLWAYVAVLAAAVLASAFPPHSETLQTALEQEPTTWLWSNAWASVALFSILSLAWLVGLVGLFRFKTWGRSIALYTTLASLLVSPLVGSTLYWGLESGLYEACSIAWGAILALSYFSPVSSRFGR
jgi:hypothetical protein